MLYNGGLQNSLRCDSMKRTASDSRLGTWLTIAPCGFMAHKNENFYTILSNTTIKSIRILPKIKKNQQIFKNEIEFYFLRSRCPNSEPNRNWHIGLRKLFQTDDFSRTNTGNSSRSRMCSRTCIRPWSNS